MQNVGERQITPEVQQAIARFFGNKAVRPQLEMNFKNADYAQNGQVTKDDFTNIVFDAAKESLLPAQTMSLVSHFTNF